LKYFSCTTATKIWITWNYFSINSRFFKQTPQHILSTPIKIPSAVQIMLSVGQQTLYSKRVITCAAACCESQGEESMFHTFRSAMTCIVFWTANSTQCGKYEWKEE